MRRATSSRSGVGMCLSFHSGIAKESYQINQISFLVEGGGQNTLRMGIMVYWVQMKPETARALLDLNQRFYSQFAGAFSATRRRIQPGVQAVLAGLLDEGDWLDLGCGSGWLAVEWLRKSRSSGYWGLDFSLELLAEAQAQLAAENGSQPEQIHFQQADLSQPGWEEGLPRGHYTGGLCFAVLHHLPSDDLRRNFLRAAGGLMRPEGLLALSVWQFQNSPKFARRQVNWQAAGLDESDLDPGDTLLDWRYALPGQEQKPGLRYVHQFSSPELAFLAQETGFRVERGFESDGEGGRLGLYQVWRKT